MKDGVATAVATALAALVFTMSTAAHSADARVKWSYARSAGVLVAFPVGASKGLSDVLIVAPTYATINRVEFNCAHVAARVQRAWTADDAGRPRAVESDGSWISVRESSPILTALRSACGERVHARSFRVAEGESVILVARRRL